uniref:Uncharacterized protein n=1 Tax=Anguilla anguilla TaxID=7936 RepID=A0A0E9P8I7_ANGAN
MGPSLTERLLRYSVRSRSVTQLPGLR